MKETEDSRAACLRNVGERNSHEDGNEGQPTGVLQDLAVTDDHQTCVGSPASGTAGAPGSRSSPRFTRPNLLLKRPLTTTAAVARSPTKTSGPLKENRQAANERAVQVYSAGAAIGARRPRPPSRAGSTSPGGGGSRSRWNERGLPSEERKRPVASAGRRQSFPLPSHDVGMGKQVRDAVSTLPLCSGLFDFLALMWPKTNPNGASIGASSRTARSNFKTREARLLRIYVFT